MYIKRRKGAISVTLPDGRVMTLSDLPPVSTKRWVASRKAIVVEAVQAGLISKQDACARYDLSRDELQEWIKALQAHGQSGLKTTKLQMYKQF